MMDFVELYLCRGVGRVSRDTRQSVSHIVYRDSARDSNMHCMIIFLKPLRRPQSMFHDF